MGFYAPAQIVRDAREHGVEARPPDVNASDWDSTLEEREDGALALRLGFRQIDGFREDWARAHRRGAGSGFYADASESLRGARPAQGGAGAAGRGRRVALAGARPARRAWAVRRLPDDVALPLFEAAGAAELGEEPLVALPAMPLREHVAADYQTLRLSLKAHPMRLPARRCFAREACSTCRAGAGRSATDGACAAAGVVLVRQRPGSAKGVVFMTSRTRPASPTASSGRALCERSAGR